MAKTDGGPAFPVPVYRTNGENVVLSQMEGGMSLRDYFAAHALTGWISSGALARICESDKASPHGAMIILAASCYQLADAMLAEREK